MTTEKSCSTCRFFEWVKTCGSQQNHVEGTCHRYPPTMPMGEKYEPGVSNKFPIVLAGPFGDWCGEWKKEDRK